MSDESSPKVKRFRGKRRIFKIGLTKIVRKPKTTAAKKRLCQEAKRTPGKTKAKR